VSAGGKGLGPKRVQMQVEMPCELVLVAHFGHCNPDAVTPRFWEILARDWQNWLWLQLPSGAAAIETEVDREHPGMVRVRFVVGSGVQ
jgi:hypothetical protein